MGKKSLKTRCNKFTTFRSRENQPRKPKQTKISEFFNEINDHETEMVQNTVCDTIYFAQNNHQKRIVSTELITNLTEGKNRFVILGQEPSTFGCQVTGVNNKHSMIYADTEKPRSYVCVSKNLNAWAVEHLCSRDVATCIINTDSRGSKKILACSIYWDGRIDEPPREAIEAARMAREKDYILVLGGDVNAQNTLFGGRITNKRGKRSRISLSTTTWLSQIRETRLHAQRAIPDR